MDQVHRSLGAGAFVGRAEEVAELTARLDQALGGRGCLVLIAGEPGVGKTHLAEEVADLARRRGVPVLWGGAVDSEGVPPFWPLRQVIRAWRMTVDQATFAAAVGEGAGDIALLDPATASSAHIRSTSGPVDAGEERFRLFESVSQLLRAAAEHDGMVVVLDDLHWADSGTLLFLQHLARAIGSSRLLLMVTYRDTEHRLDDVITGLIRERSTARIVLGGLSREDVLGQLTALGREVPPEVASGIWSRTRGNPFFVVELARLGLDDGMAHGTEKTTWERDIPDTVRSVIGRRVELLSMPCQEMLRAASIIGSDFTALRLAALTGAGIGTVRPLIDEAVAARLLLRSRGSGDRFDFAHELTREVVSRELGGAELVRLHGLLAAHIEEAHAVDLEDHLAELAHHRSEAAGGGRSAAAADCAWRAADQAMEQLGYEDAVRLYGLALAAAPAGWSGCRREKLLLAQATAQYRSGDLAAAATTSQKAASAARRSGDRETQAEAALVLEGVGEPRWSSAIAELAEEALEALEPGDSELRSRLLAQLAVACFYSGSMERVDPLSGEAVSMAERLGNDKALVAALRARQMARGSSDGAAERLGIGRRMLEIAARTRQPSTALWGHIWSIDALIQLGDIPAAEQELGALSLVVDRLRQPLARWHLEKLQATIAQVEGRFADARRHAENALAIARSSGNTMAESAYHGLMRIVAVLTGGDVSAHETTIAPSGLFGELQQTQMAWAAALTGRREVAEERYRRLAPMTHWRIPPAVSLVALAFRAEVATALEKRADAAILYQRLLPYADQFVVGGAGALACSGVTRLYLGRLAAFLGRPELAISHLRAAVEQNRAAGAHPYTAESQAALASVLARRGREGDAGRALLLLDECARTAVHLGMGPLAVRAEELRVWVSGLTRRGRVITPREREVARLVARGLTNREIGAALHVTERTAGNHVQHILDKLGFTARSQVAAWSVTADGPAGGAYE